MSSHPSQRAADRKVIEDVAIQIRHSLVTNLNTSGHHPYSVTLTSISNDEFPFNPISPYLSQSEISSFVEKRFDRPNPSLLVMMAPKHGIAILSIRSSEPDGVVDGMYSQLKNGSKQFSGGRPGILCAHFLELTPKELVSLHSAQEMGKPSNINRIATRLFRDTRPFLHTVSFTVPGRLRETKNIKGNVRQREFAEDGLAYSFANPKHPSANDPDLKLF